MALNTGKCNHLTPLGLKELNHILKRFKPSWQKEVSVRVLAKHIKCSNITDNSDNAHTCKFI